MQDRNAADRRFATEVEVAAVTAVVSTACIMSIDRTGIGLIGVGLLVTGVDVLSAIGVSMTPLAASQTPTIERSTAFATNFALDVLAFALALEPVVAVVLPETLPSFAALAFSDPHELPSVLVVKPTALLGLLQGLYVGRLGQRAHIHRQTRVCAERHQPHKFPPVALV